MEIYQNLYLNSLIEEENYEKEKIARGRVRTALKKIETECMQFMLQPQEDLDSENRFY